MVDLHGNTPVVFDFDAAQQLVTASQSAAQAISGQAGSRAGWVQHAGQDFSGYYATLFAHNAQVAQGDGQQLVTALNDLATLTQGLITAANSENKRRATAAAWYEKQSHRSWLQKGWDDVFGSDSPPEGPQPPPTPQLTAIPTTHERQIGGQGSDGGTSSARPANLDSFASGSETANQELEPHHAKVSSLLATFNANTQWGQIDGGSVVAAFGKWLQANHNDVRWARTIAKTFANAGSEGALVTLSNASLGEALKAAHVSATRQDLTITVPEAKGFKVTTGYSLDPVNTATGNFIESETDLVFGDAGSLALTRMYNSFSIEESAFGQGWSSLAEAGLELDAEAASFTLADGRVVVFPRLGDGWDRPGSDNLWLATLPDGGHRISGNDGTWWVCSPGGRLTSYGVGPGSSVTLDHDSEGHLTTIAHERGRSITLEWSTVAGRDRVVAARTSDGRLATYLYDEHGHLTSVTSAGTTRSYRWDCAEQLVTAVVDGDGVVEAENAYDEQRRVRLQLTPFGRRVRFSYLPGRVTVVDDEDGTNSNTWIADARGRLVGVIDSHDKRLSTAYDQRGNPVVVTDRDGATTVHEYDGRGRRTRTVTPTGADLRFAYDEQDRIVSVMTGDGTDHDATTTYAYLGEDRSPSVITDPEGGITRLTWEDGLLTRVIGPTGVTATMTYDEHGSLLATTDAEGSTARLEYDDTGRVTAAITPLGHRTTYSYDEAGLLASTTAPDGAVWRYEYTSAGRRSAIVDPTGARTTVEYDASGEAGLLVDPLGRATRLEHDAFGNRSGVTLPDGSHWTFGHDSLSRPTTVTSPDGATWTSTFDQVGRQTGFSDPTGVSFTAALEAATTRVTEGDVSRTTRFDVLGRPVGNTGPDGGETVLVYDRCGRVVESVDAEGGLTRLRYDAAGNVVELVGPSGATTTYEWDHCGRLAATVDAAGGRTAYAYDADRRLVAVTLPTGETATTEYDACGRVTSRQVPGVGTATFAYDAAGRLVETSDPADGTRRLRYDAAGQLVEAIDGNGGVTRYEYDDLGRATAITDPLGNVTRREFDALGRCVASTDPLGRTTRAGYDAGGRQLWQENPDGRRVTWTYDAMGCVSSLSVDGVLQTSMERDLRARRLTITDLTGIRSCTHELVWNGRQQLVSRSRDGVAVTWAYDAEGRRTAMTTPDGATTSYSYDALGRLTAVDHPLLGRASMEYDASGRLLAATAGTLIQSWEHHDGFVSAHTVTGPDGSTRTEIHRDAAGRITAIGAGDGETTTFDYDAACQLIAAHSGGTGTTWRYDAAGRLVTETTDGRRVEHTYDAAGQLLLTTTATAGGEATVRYEYDPLGRRTSATTEAGTTTYEWSARGWLSAITAPERRSVVHVDALGELASIDDVPIVHDTAAWAAPAVLAGDLPIIHAGALTGIGSTWTTPGWRGVRGTSPTDPWAPAPAQSGLPGLPATLGIGTHGELSLGGLEWMGARVYDPASRGFLSTDPLDPITGTGWAGNPYSYAGNDPLHALDPLGLRPATDADLKAWTADHAGAVGAAEGWLKNNWEYVAAGAMIVAGGILVFSGVGSAVGIGLISAGVDTGIQKLTTGHVDWRQVAIAGVVGGVTGGAAAAWAEGASGAAATGTAALRSTILANGTIGAGGSETTYLATNLVEGKGVSVRGAIGAAAGGFVAGGAGAAAEPLGGTIAQQLGQKATGPLSTVISRSVSTVGGAAGGATQQMISDGHLNAKALVFDAGTGYFGDKISDGAGKLGERVTGNNWDVGGHETLARLANTGPKSLSSGFNIASKNGGAAIRSGVTGTLIDGGKELGLDKLDDKIPFKKALGIE